MKSLFSVAHHFGMKFESINTAVRGTIQVIKYDSTYDFYVLNTERKYHLLFSKLSLEQIIIVLKRINSHNLWLKCVRCHTAKEPILIPARNLISELNKLFDKPKLRSVYYSFPDKKFSVIDGELIVGTNILSNDCDYFLEIYHTSLHSYHSFIHNTYHSYIFIITHYIFNSYNMIHDNIYTFIENDKNTIYRYFQQFLEKHCIEDFPK